MRAAADHTANPQNRGASTSSTSPPPPREIKSVTEVSECSLLLLGSGTCTRHHQLPLLFPQSTSLSIGDAVVSRAAAAAASTPFSVHAHHYALFDLMPEVVFSQMLSDFVCPYLDAVDVCRLAQVCRASFHAQLHPKVWRSLTRTVFRLSEASCIALEKLCAPALSSAVQRRDRDMEASACCPTRRAMVAPTATFGRLSSEKKQKTPHRGSILGVLDEDREIDQDHAGDDEPFFSTGDCHVRHGAHTPPGSRSVQHAAQGRSEHMHGRSVRLPVGDMLYTLTESRSTVSQVVGAGGIAFTPPTPPRSDTMNISLETAPAMMSAGETFQHGRLVGDDGDDDDESELRACRDEAGGRSASTPATRPSTAPHRPIQQQLQATSGVGHQLGSSSPNSPLVVAFDGELAEGEDGFTRSSTAVAVAAGAASARQPEASQVRGSSRHHQHEAWNTSPMVPVNDDDDDDGYAVDAAAATLLSTPAAAARNAGCCRCATSAAAATSTPPSSHARVVCAATAAISLSPLRGSSIAHCASLHFPWKEYFVALYKRRIVNVIGLHKMQRVHAVHAVAAGDFVRAERFMTEAIGHSIQAGCCGVNELVRQLVADLCTRGHILRKMGREEESLGDYSLAWVLDPYCMEAYAVACEITAAVNNNNNNSNAPANSSQHHRSNTSGVGSNSSRRGATYFLSPEFDFEEQYDAVVSSGTVFERAAFIFESMYFRGPECAAYVIAYILCDAVKYWPSRLLKQAQAVATSDFQRLICHSWKCFDNGQPEKSGEYAELAVELLPKDYKHSVERLLELSKSSATGSGDGFQASDIAAAVLREPCSPTVLRGNSLSPPPLASFAYFTLAFVSQQCDVAVDAYRKCLLTNPWPSRKAVALNNLASLLMSRNELASAKMLLEASIETNARYFMTYRNLAKCLTRLGDREAAHSCLTQAISRCRPLPADAFSERSKYSTQTAAEDLDVATRMNPRMSYPYRLRAALLMDRQRDLDALRELDKALEIGFDAPDAALRAVFKRDLGDLDGAISDMAIAIALCPTNSEYIGWLKEALGVSEDTMVVVDAAANTAGAGQAAASVTAAANETVNQLMLLGGGEDNVDSEDIEFDMTEIGVEYDNEDDIDDNTREEVPHAAASRLLDADDDDDDSGSDKSSSGESEMIGATCKVSDTVLNTLLSQYQLCMQRSHSSASGMQPFSTQNGGGSAGTPHHLQQGFFARCFPDAPAGGNATRRRGPGWSSARGFVADGLHISPPHRAAVQLDLHARVVYVARKRTGSSDLKQYLS